MICQFDGYIYFILILYLYWFIGLCWLILYSIEVGVNSYFCKIIRDKENMIMKKLLMSITLGMLFVSMFLLLLPSGTVKAQELDENLPRMTLTEFINSNEKEAIITEFDIPKFQQANEALSRLRYNANDGGAYSCWMYQYSAGPYDLYKKGNQYKLVYNTGMVSYVTKTVADGIMGAPSWNIYIKDYLKGRCG